MDGVYAIEVDECESLINQPLVSFLMSVRSDSPTLNKCLESLTLQTYKNIEIVIILDSASPLAEEKIRGAAQNSPLFRIIANPNPKNLSRALNLGTSHCKGKYIARIDADDICTIDRIDIQLKYLESIDERFAIVGSRAGGLLHENREGILTVLGPKDFSTTNPLIHPSIMVRKEILETFKYSESYRYSQDYELWTRIIRFHGVAVVNRELIEFDTRERNAGYVLTQEFYFLKANLKFLSSNLMIRNVDFTLADFAPALYMNITRQINLLKNLIRLRLGRF